MADADLILKFEIAPNRSPEAQSVAEAINAYVDVLRAAASVVEPGSSLSVELVGVEPGSQLFRLALRKLEDAAERVKKGGEEYPLVSKTALALAALIGSTVIGTAITHELTPDPRIPPDQMAVFEKMENEMAQSLELQRESARFWGVMQDEPAFDRLDVLRGADREPFYQIPRGEFAERSGMWSGDAEEQSTQVETRRTTWDVILVKPVLVPEPRRWTFARDGLEFSALMTDKSILQAIHDKTLPIQMAEGISMKVEVQYRERFDGKAWLPVPGSHRIRRVLHPLPYLAPDSAPLFSTSRRP